jgi:hypothetical protein
MFLSNIISSPKNRKGNMKVKTEGDAGEMINVLDMHGWKKKVKSTKEGRSDKRVIEG